MKLLLLALALVAISVQEHQEPPTGWLCANRANTPVDHQCKCVRTCAWNPDTKQVEEKEDPKCRSWCYRDHCTCLSECDSH